ncbi:recombinase family protein [Streptomyces sp. NPDC057623]|uniref:recombinase family protein n=1 Tax=Streptomyces sp. NPDC057623 TaxID=3346187 RepID=UPI0036B09F01
MGKSVMSAIDIAARAIAGKCLRAVDYLRVSTEDQTKGYGIAYTGKRTAAHITRKQWDHVGTFKDEGESGTLPWEQREGATKIGCVQRSGVRVRPDPGVCSGIGMVPA